MEILKPALMMVVNQMVFAARMNVLYKLATNDGMSPQIVVAYRFIFAAVFLTPLALFIERNKRPKFSWSILMQASVSGLLGGALVQNLYVKSVEITSVTFSTAIINLIPVVTFVLSMLFRLEKVELGSGAGKAKVLGTLIGIGGAMVLTFYKGVEIHLSPYHHNKQPHLSPSPHHSSIQQVLGFLLALGSCFSYSLWLIIQAKMSKKYPCEYSSTAMMCSMAAIQSSIYALCTQKGFSQWKLGWDIRLLTSAYTGIVASSVSITLISWCVRVRGPVFVSVFGPLQLVTVTIADYFLLDEKLYLGCILGSVLIVGGLYVVLWGKDKEMKAMAPRNPSESTDTQSLEIVTTTSTNGVDQK